MCSEGNSQIPCSRITPVARSPTCLWQTSLFPSVSLFSLIPAFEHWWRLVWHTQMVLVADLLVARNPWISKLWGQTMCGYKVCCCKSSWFLFAQSVKFLLLHQGWNHCGSLLSWTSHFLEFNSEKFLWGFSSLMGIKTYEFIVFPGGLVEWFWEMVSCHFVELRLFLIFLISQNILSWWWEKCGINIQWIILLLILRLSL